MKKLFALALVSISAAQAATLTELLSTSETTITAACADGYRIGAMPRTNQEQIRTYNLANGEARIGRFLSDYRSLSTDPLARFRSLTRPVELQTPAGSAYTVCAKRAGELAPQPAAASLSPSFNVYVTGEATSRQAAEGWNAVVTFIDASGTELGRIQPVTAVKGEAQDWRPSCTASGCRWYGKNIYAFRLMEIPATAAKLRVIFTRGNGIEQREYTAADFDGYAVNDPK